MTFRRKVVTTGLCFALAFGTCAPVAAFADPSSDDVATAAAKIESYAAELNELQNSLATTSTDLEQTQYELGENQSQIDDTTAKLQSARDDLGQTMAESYKAGNDSLLSLVLNSTSFEDFQSRLYYSSKINDQKTAQINEVNNLQNQLNSQRAELESKRDSQQKSVDQMQSSISSYQQKVADAQAYYDSLSAEVQNQVTEQAEADGGNNDVAQAVNTVTQAAESIPAQQDDNGNNNASSNDTNSATSSNSSNASSNSNSSSNNGSSSKSNGDSGKSGNSGSSNSAKSNSSSNSNSNSSNSNKGKSNSSSSNKSNNSSRNNSSNSSSSNTKKNSSSSKSGGASGQGLATAYSMIGVPYVWGGTSASGVDCSGLVCYSYGYKRGRTTYDMIASLKASGDWKTDMSQLQVGDLVFPHSGHVGIYIGNGQMIHAPSPGRTVCITSVYAFIGGGTY